MAQPDWFYGKGRKIKFYKDVNDIADYYRKTKTSQRLNLIISVLYNLLILLFVVGTIYSVVKSGTFSSLFGDKQDLTRRFDCQSGEVKDIVKTYTEANFFTQLYNGTCRLYHENDGGG